MTFIKKFETNNKNGFAKKYLTLAVSFILVLVIAEIWANNIMINYGERLDKISSLETTLKLENQILENEIAKHASLMSVASKSADLGFSTPQSIKYIR